MQIVSGRVVWVDHNPIMDIFYYSVSTSEGDLTVSHWNDDIKVGDFVKIRKDDRGTLTQNIFRCNESVFEFSWFLEGF